MEETMKLSYQSRNGHTRTRQARKSTNGDATLRRKIAIERLEAQLECGLKQPPKTFLSQERIPLEEVDVLRIKKEIKTLKERI